MLNDNENIEIINKSIKFVKEVIFEYLSLIILLNYIHLIFNFLIYLFYIFKKF